MGRCEDSDGARRALTRSPNSAEQADFRPASRAGPRIVIYVPKLDSFVQVPITKRSWVRGPRPVAYAGAMEPIDLDLLAASLRADSGDVSAFVESLAAKLEDALAGRVKVQRSRHGLMGPKAVRMIALDAGGERLELVRGEGDAIETRRARTSGGIVLKTEALDTDTWLAALGEALAIEAQRNERTRQALERLLIT